MSFTLELIRKYKDVDKEILLTYQKEDSYFLCNEEDPDLMTFVIWLPQAGKKWKVHTIDGNFAEVTMPEYHKMTNWGLPAHEQKFVYEKMPYRLEKLIEQCDNISELIWNTLENAPYEWYQEIEWIKKQIRKDIVGDWQWINGKPRYLDPWHFRYLNYWKFAKGKKPDYRDKDRRFYYALRYAYTTTEAPLKNDKGQIEFYELDGIKVPKTYDFGRRTIVGMLYPKGRRDGATNKVECMKYAETTRKKGVYSGCIADTGTKSEEIYETITLPGWRQMPFFFKPITSGYDDPAGGLKFSPQKAKETGRHRYTERDKAKQKNIALRSEIDYASTSEGSFYDGRQMFILLVDEAGKTVQTKVTDRHQVLINCVAQGNRSVVEGFLAYPSTVGEMQKKGGFEFARLSKLSNWEDRDIIGQTASGLINVYFPSYDGLEGYIDEYGDTVIETPKKPIMGIDGKLIKIGSRDAIMSKRAELLAKNDTDAYNEEVRLFPIKLRECFRTKDGDIGFNLKKINDRIDELRYMGDVVQRGNFVWRNRIQDGMVDFEPHPNGRWVISKLEPNNNRRYLDGDNWFPEDVKYTACGDPFKFGKTKSGEESISKGGGSVFWDYDNTIDGGKDISQWTTHTTVCTYLNRPSTTDEYCEDMLMMCVYYNAYMYPEINVPAIWDHFVRRGYAGYLKYDIDPKTGMYVATPGFNSLGKDKQRLFNAVRDYIEKHSHRDKHMDFLVQCSEISDLDDMTKYDLFTACGGAIMGSKIQYMNDNQRRTQSKSEGLKLFVKKSYK